MTESYHGSAKSHNPAQCICGCAPGWQVYHPHLDTYVQGCEHSVYESKVSFRLLHLSHAINHGSSDMNPLHRPECGAFSMQHEHDPPLHLDCPLATCALDCSKTSEDRKKTASPPVVHGSQTVVPLLPRRVPDFKLDMLLWQRLCQESGTNRRLLVVKKL